MLANKIGLKGSKGFTLLEVIIVIGLVAFMYVVALPNISLKSGHEVATQLGRLSEDIKSAYDYSVLTGKPLRLVFQLYTGKYWLEVPDRMDIKLGFDKQSRDLSPAEEEEKIAEFNDDFEKYVDLAGEAVKSTEDDENINVETPIIKAKNSLQGAKWSKLDSLEWKDRDLGSHLIIKDFHAEHHENAIDIEEFGQEAIAKLYFFPRGYVERAVMHIYFKAGEGEVDPDQAPYTVLIHPFEGYAEVRSGFEEIDIHSEKNAF